MGGSISLLAGAGLGTQTGSLAGSINIDAGISNGSAGNGKINIGNSGSTSGNAATILIGNDSSNILMQGLNVNLSSAGVLQLAGAQTADISTKGETTTTSSCVGGCGVHGYSLTVQPGAVSGTCSGTFCGATGSSIYLISGASGVGLGTGGTTYVTSGSGSTFRLVIIIPYLYLRYNR